MRVKHIILIAAMLATLPGCNRAEQTVPQVEQNLTVEGPRDGVERFAGQQRSRRLGLAVFAVRPVGNDRVEATVMLPATFTGKDLVHTTREALAAGLEYNYEGRQSVQTR